ncbi:hypothetical protein BMS3Abin07_01610 [bacterium BMS3Abin07]|nr:hypothetical protein BMS3Abin07_01610 [bacterium BMS3Abin07]HDZ87830.1 hypothetical protein [Nitrospirota bacterium]
MLSCLENEILGNPEGLAALDKAIERSADALLDKRGTYRLILDVDFMEDKTHGEQECSTYKTATSG